MVVEGPSIVRDPTDLPPPLAKRDPQTVQVNLEAIEITGKLDTGANYNFWTFDGKVPGPMIRIRVGDTAEVHMKNSATSHMMHNVDFHAVTGPGGGAAATMAAPGETHGFTFKAMKPGLYVYHCATPVVAQHISNGMYGMILVEPEEGLKPVDHEFYVMQGEIYTEQSFGSRGLLTGSFQKLINERPEYFVFNGSVGALTDKAPMEIKAGETVRIFFGVGGPNYTSSFHVIGEIFDSVQERGSLTDKPTHDIQTISVPPGGAGIVEMKVEVPGKYILVDHALSRLQRGLVGFIKAEGEPEPKIFSAKPNPYSPGMH